MRHTAPRPAPLSLRGELRRNAEATWCSARPARSVVPHHAQAPLSLKEAPSLSAHPRSATVGAPPSSSYRHHAPRRLCEDVHAPNFARSNPGQWGGPSRCALSQKSTEGPTPTPDLGRSAAGHASHTDSGTLVRGAGGRLCEERRRNAEAIWGGGRGKRARTAHAPSLREALKERRSNLVRRGGLASWSTAPSPLTPQQTPTAARPSGTAAAPAWRLEPARRRGGRCCCPPR